RSGSAENVYGSATLSPGVIDQRRKMDDLTISRGRVQRLADFFLSRRVITQPQLGVSHKCPDIAAVRILLQLHQGQILYFAKGRLRLDYMALLAIGIGLVEPLHG